MSARFDIAPAGPEHESFIRDAFAKSVRETSPYRWVPRPVLLDDFTRRRHSPAAVTAIAHIRNEPDLWLGFLSAVPINNEVLYAFSKYVYRRDPQLRVATTLAIECGIRFDDVVKLRFWTRAAERIASKPGYRLVHCVTEVTDGDR